jgi:hypothetical protein
MVGLVKTIDINVYTTLSLALSRVTKLDDASYKTLYSSVEYSLTGLYQAVLQYHSYTEVKNNYEVALENQRYLTIWTC